MLIRTKEDAFQLVVEVITFVTCVDDDEVTIDKNFADDLNVDSLSMVELARFAEDRYGLEISDGQLNGLRTVGDAVNHIFGRKDEINDLNPALSRLPAR